MNYQWISIVAVALSAFLPIPIPNWILPLQVSMGTTQIDATTQHASIIWGKGIVRLKNIHLYENQKQLFFAKAVDLEFGTKLGKSFAVAQKVYISEAEADLDREKIESLTAGQAKGSNPVALTISNLTILWRDKARQWKGRIVTGNGIVEADAARITAAVEIPSIDVHCTLQALGTNRLSSWQIRIKGEQELSRPKSREFLPQGLEVGEGVLALEGAVDVEEGEVTASNLNANFSGVKIRFRDSESLSNAKSWKIEEAEGNITGSLKGGFLANAKGRWGEYLIETQGAALSINERWNIHLRGKAPKVTLDSALRQKISRMSPTVGEIFDALNISGSSAVRFGLDSIQGIATNWAAVTQESNLGLTYLGFPERDGSRLSFPYPVKEIHGDIAITDEEVLLDVEGRIGSSPIQGTGQIFGPGTGSPGISIHLGANALPIDKRVAEALKGLPEASLFWQEMGNPAGGNAQVEVILHRAIGSSKTVDVTVEGRVSGTNIQPLVLPVDGILEVLDFSWSPGEASFKGLLSTLGSQADITGELWTPQGALSPAIRMSAKSQGLALYKKDLEVLAGALKITEAISSFTAQGPANCQMHFARSGEAAEPQVLVAWEEGPLNLAWSPAEMILSQAAGQGAAIRVGGKTLITFPQINGQGLGGEIHLTARKLPADSSAQALAICRDINPVFKDLNNLQFAGDANLQIDIKKAVSAKLYPRNLSFRNQNVKGHITSGLILASGNLLGPISGTLELVDGTWGAKEEITIAEGKVEIQNAFFTNNEFAGQLQLSNGTWFSSGLTFSKMQGIATRDSNGWQLKKLGGNILGGRLSPEVTNVQIADSDDKVSATIKLEDLDLKSVRSWLGSEGQWSGKLDTLLNLKGPLGDPLTWQGAMKLHVTHGQLATIPVLTEVWRAIGVAPPLFRRGSLNIVAPGNGQLTVEKFKLDHDLLTVEGKGSIGLDGYLNLKLSLNPFDIVRSIPLISHAIDLLAEHDVYGPASSPRIRKHPLLSIKGAPLPRVPFPFWLPPASATSWVISPALRVDPRPIRD